METKKSIIRSIGWGKTIFILTLGFFMLFAGNDGYKTHQVYEEMEAISLSEIKERFKDGDLVKINSFNVDIKNRVRGLYDRAKSRDLSLLIPLRSLNENQEDKINFLYLMPESYNDSIRILFEEYQESRLDMQEIHEMVVEVSEMDELPGDVPMSVRKNKKVNDDVMILWHKEDDPAWGVFVLFGSAFILYWAILYYKYFLKSRREEELY